MCCIAFCQLVVFLLCPVHQPPSTPFLLLFSQSLHCGVVTSNSSYFLLQNVMIMGRLAFSSTCLSGALNLSRSVSLRPDHSCISVLGGGAACCLSLTLLCGALLGALALCQSASSIQSSRPYSSTRTIPFLFLFLRNLFCLSWGGWLFVCCVKLSPSGSRTGTSMSVKENVNILRRKEASA